MNDKRDIALLIFKIAVVAAYAAIFNLVIKALIIGIQLMETYL